MVTSNLRFTLYFSIYSGSLASASSLDFYTSLSISSSAPSSAPLSAYGSASFLVSFSAFFCTLPCALYPIWLSAKLDFITILSLAKCVCYSCSSPYLATRERDPYIFIRVFLVYRGQSWSDLDMYLESVSIGVRKVKRAFSGGSIYFYSSCHR